MSDSPLSIAITDAASARIRELEAKLRDEEERHAALQSRCYEGFPSATDGIFDALREADETERASGAIRAELDAKLAKADAIFGQIAAWAESARLTCSRDIGDWQDDMSYIEAMAKGWKQ